MLLELWNSYLYLPLFNALIVLYNTIGFANLGLAVIWLTVLIRVVLIPLTFIEERNRSRYVAIGKKWKELERDIPSDVVLRRDIFKKHIREQQVSPWARLASLGLQGLVLVLLYQVFVTGFRSPESVPLYAWVPRPVSIETSFFGLFDVAQKNAVFSFVVAFVLFLTIWREQRATKLPLSRSQLWFRLFFPLFTFVALALLPSVKALFILTSMCFTMLFHVVKLFIDRHAEKKKKEKKAAEPKVLLTPEGNPWEALKK